MTDRDETATVQLNLRAPRDLAGELEEWVKDINAARRVNKVSKNSVLVSLLAWGLIHRPPWAGSDPPAQEQAPPRPYPIPPPPTLLQVSEPARQVVYDEPAAEAGADVPVGGRGVPGVGGGRGVPAKPRQRGGVGKRGR